MPDDGQNAAKLMALTADAANSPVALESAKSSNPYSFASQLSEARAMNGGTTLSALPSAVEQVMMQLSRNVKNGNDQMTLQLHPADLGRINIKLDFLGDGKVQGTVIADNQTTLDMLSKLHLKGASSALCRRQG